MATTRIDGGHRLAIPSSADVRLDRPAVLKAVDRRMRVGLAQALRGLAEDDAVAVVVIRERAAFCAGQHQTESPTMTAAEAAQRITDYADHAGSRAAMTHPVRLPSGIGSQIAVLLVGIIGLLYLILAAAFVLQAPCNRPVRPPSKAWSRRPGSSPGCRGGLPQRRPHSINLWDDRPSRRRGA